MALTVLNPTRTGKVMYVYSPRKNRLQVLNKLDGVPLEELKKIKKGHNAYLEKTNAYAVKLKQVYAENEKVSASNSAASLRMERWERQNIAPLTTELQRLMKLLDSHSVGFIKRQLMASIQFEGGHYDPQPARGIIQQIENVRRRLGEVYDRQPPSEHQRLDSLPREPRPSTTLIIGGQKITVDFLRLNVSELDALIEKHQNKINENKTRTSELKARAALNESEKRRQAQGLRRSLSKQLSLIDVCPYCDGKLGDANAHLDHIYPVSKGGNSSERNLVFVCAGCNLMKRNMTLRNFLKSSGYNEERVYGRLETLKKDF